MTYCGHCGNIIISGPNKALLFAADSRVCSRDCQRARILTVTCSDPKLEYPGNWQFAIPITKKSVCGFCSKHGAEIQCPWCHDGNAVSYCSVKCQQQHWSSGHAMVCWRFGRVQPTPIQPTPSFLETLKDMSGLILGCSGWFR